MDTTKLKRFAAEARNILMQGVAHRLTALGFEANGTPTEEPQLFAGGATFMGEVVSEDFYDKWQSLNRAIQSHGMKEIAEEAAYTWFNRLMAIRIMVKNGLIPPILQYESEGVHVPLLVTEARQGRTPALNEYEERKLNQLLDDDSQTAEQFQILIVAFCHQNPVINSCFGHISDYTELLLPANILADGGFIDLINHTDFIAEEDYKSPELIGWLYQFYISDRKDEVFAKKGKYEPDEIAPATQIFTPNWIVKYMVQNTIGRIYLDNNPYEDELKDKWKYLVEPTVKTPNEAIYHFEDLKDLKAADLASGSGHILNEAFDLLYDLYVNEGYSRTDAIKNIFRYNLVGIDIDTRAKQLATFALLMKACQKDKSFLDGKVMPRVYNMPRPINEMLPNYDAALPNFLMGSNQKMLEELRQSLKLMNNADTLGSIMKFDLSDATRNTVKVRVEEYEQLLANGEIVTEENRLLIPYMRIILALTDKYAAICMNPPYMGSGRFDATLSNYVKNNYPKSKADLFAVFMDVAIDRLANCGKYGMINMHAWMFLSSFEDVRKSILDNEHIDSLLHLGPRTFDELSGEVVQNAAFVVSKSKTSSDKGTYFRLVDGRNCADKEQMFLDARANHAENVYYTNVEQGNLEKIPGCPIGYWVSEQFINTFNNPPLSKFGDAVQGLHTCDNDSFLKLWYEVANTNIGFCCSSIEETIRSQKKWFPINKGGTYRKWYGNQMFVINWKNNAEDIRRTGKGILGSQSFALKPLLGWSDISSGNIAFRYFPNGFFFDVSGPSIFIKDSKDIEGMLGLINSNTCNQIMKLIAPTLHFNVGQVAIIPINERSLSDDSIRLKVQYNISSSKRDWDSHETSWDFEANPLVAQCSQSRNNGSGATSYRIENFVKEFEEQWEARFYQLKDNEEELNRQFIEIYGLQDELTPDVPLDEITILQQGEISIEDNHIKWHPDVIMKQLISYAVGCMMGRYSLDKPGLILADQGDGLNQFKELVPNSKFDPDDDGIIPLMSAQSDFADNATVKFKQWLAVTFGEDTLVENLNFIEASLGKTIDDYFVKDFWKDHKKLYQNRPIYWLFSSKKGAFQCLTYMHRMDAYTAERVRTKYLLPHIEWLLQKQNELTENLTNLTSQERRELDNISKQIQECREYHDRLHVVADHQIGFDLDDGVVVNYAKFGDVLAAIK